MHLRLFVKELEYNLFVVFNDTTKVGKTGILCFLGNMSAYSTLSCANFLQHKANL